MIDYIKIKDYSWLMDEAYSLAIDAQSKGEVPVGAVIVNEQGSVISKAYNLKEENHNPCHHAEILAIGAAAKKQKNWRLTNHELVVTLEPCPMCFNAALQARIKRIVFAAYDYKGGAISLGYNFHLDERLNHKIEVIGGMDHFKNSKLLSDFFRARRSQYKEIN
ncbi:nucleoside deaminase [Bacteriovoracaceae bacterium]|nr:nucleoside deaminase [Bacteriovoracaceae bacterium]